MTNPNMPDPNRPYGNHGTPPPQQWANQPQHRAFGPGHQVPGSTATTQKKSSLPGWPTFVAIGLFLVTLISSFLPMLKMTTDRDAQRAMIEEQFGEFGRGQYGFDIEDALVDFALTLNWWGGMTIDAEGFDTQAQMIEQEILNAPEFQADQALLVALASLILVAYLAAIVVGFFKKDRITAIIGLVAAALQVLALILAVISCVGANSDPEVRELTPTSLGLGFWLWLVVAITAIAVFAFALLNSTSKKPAYAPGFASPGQPGHPQGFRPGQPQQQGFQPNQQFPPQGQPGPGFNPGHPQQGFQPNQQFPPQGQPGPGFNPGQQPGPGAGNPYQQYGR